MGVVGGIDGGGRELRAPRKVSMGAGPRTGCGSRPEVEMQQDEARARSACTVVQMTVGGHAYERGSCIGFGAGGGDESGPPWSGVSLGYNGDAVGLVSPCFEERRTEEREWWEEQAELGAKGLAPWARGVSPAVLGQRVDPSRGGFGVEGVESSALCVGGGGEQVDGDVEASTICQVAD